MFSTSSVLCGFRLFKLKLREKKYKQKTSLKSCKTEIKILANPQLA